MSPCTTEGEAAAETMVTVDSQTIQLGRSSRSPSPSRSSSRSRGSRPGPRCWPPLELPDGAELITDGDVLVVNVTQQISAEALEAELAEAEAEAGIEHEEPEAAEAARPPRLPPRARPEVGLLPRRRGASEA